MLNSTDAIIHANRRITTRQLALQFSISTGSVCSIIETLGYSKVCSKLVPRSLTTDHRIQRKTISSELLEHFNAEGEDFLSRIVTGDETWVHHFEPETKRQSMEWHHPQLSRKKKFETDPSAGKVIVTVFWDCGGVILVDVMPRGATINSSVIHQHPQQVQETFPASSAWQESSRNAAPA
jgi:histone-lysine N-methyltransferase SETMAR